MTTTKGTTVKGKTLLPGVTIPGSPLWNMGLAAATGSTTDFHALQDAIDHLTIKAKRSLPSAFTVTEKDFLVEIFESLWWGGHVKSFPEAAELADHYVNGRGLKLEIDAEVYTTSVIVRDAMAAMKDFIRAQSKTGRLFAKLDSNSSGFLASPQFRTIRKGSGRSVTTQGYVLPGGVLLAEQANLRLKNADHRFRLQSLSAPLGGGRMRTRWQVDSYYDFQPFAKGSHVTHIPLRSGMVLKMPDGLSHYMTVLTIADEFEYWAAWTDEWTL